ADVTIFPDCSSDRIGLYRLFSKLFSSLSVPTPNVTSPFAWEQRATANLAAIAPVARQAFLLVSVEDFQPEEAAEILDVDEAEISSLLNQASADISRQVATEILIIEDEPLIAMDIEQMVEGLGHSVVGIARTHREAVDLFEKT